MAERKTDRRIKRTKRLIRDALTDLMEEKGFEGITVRDLTEKADINRGTFYLHYQDKYDLLEQSENDIIKGIEAITEDINRYDSDLFISSSEYDKPTSFIIRLFEFIADNSNFMKVIIGPTGDPAFQGKLKEVMKNNILRKKESQIENNQMLVPMDYFIAYVTSAHLGVIQYWLENGMKESPEEIAMVLSKTLLLGPARVAGLIKD
ncbi:TetR/AcrR family transcriptional regulator [Halalkalibacter okhensis]|uniref:TetR family transcriptional regulator n=1 Tax=Halalkalibacter okhensis TaxID=333138 RepID=A0A0B0IK77_9BACI|nr:TetR/AcrR family transcriptional regulator C-terminal domain-containing protein [Halalkalibacter okhensis]KHF41715.1 TetR family transcriptional regulator [Halalkalibacter okhensis]